jgi:glycerol-3-phosphate dehydrogenase subunit B
MKYDVVVIGSGMSGLVAAAKAVSLRKTTLVITKGQGVLPLTTGCIDFWGFRLPNPAAVAANPFREIRELASAKPEHPYAKVLDTMAASVEFFQEIMQASHCLYQGSIQENQRVLTALGTERISALVPSSMVIRRPEKIETIIAVGFKNYPDFFPQMFLDNLKQTSLPPAAKKISLHLDLGIKATLRSGHLSTLLAREDVLREIIAQLRKELAANGIGLPASQEERLLVVFPAVLGREPAPAVWKRLTESLQAQVVEAPGLPPSIPGQRLHQALTTYGRRQGAEFCYNAAVTGFHAANGKVAALLVQDVSYATRTIEAGSVILATGSFMGGGLVAKKQSLVEPIFQLPVVNPVNQGEQARFLSPAGQVFLQAGLEVDGQLRPLDGFANLYAVGSLLAHSNYAAEKSGLGIALATGYKAGCLA